MASGFSASLPQKERSLGTVFYIQFAEDMVQVLLDSLWANKE